MIPPLFILYYLYDEAGQIIEMGDSYMSGGAVGMVLTIRNYPVAEVVGFIINRPEPYNILRLAEQETVGEIPLSEVLADKTTTVKASVRESMINYLPSVSGLPDKTTTSNTTDETLTRGPLAESVIIYNVPGEVALVEVGETPALGTALTATSKVYYQEQPSCTTPPGPELGKMVFSDGHIDQLLASMLNPFNTDCTHHHCTVLYTQPQHTTATIFHHSFTAFKQPTATPDIQPQVAINTDDIYSSGTDCQQPSADDDAACFDYENLSFHYYKRVSGNPPVSLSAVGLSRNHGPGRPRAPGCSGPLRAPPIFTHNNTSRTMLTINRLQLMTIAV